jgi:2-keto-4-pentenoate hydratase/2-oxohepta-3-ene-1,7-dioic acid hydratase in catechol pathway
MRYVTVEYPNGERSWGVLTGERFVEVPEAAARIGLNVPSDLLGFIATGTQMWAQVHAVLPELAQHSTTTPWRLLAPIPMPIRNVFAIGRNYADHAAEAGSEAPPDVPIVFSKAVDECTPPDGRVVADPTLTTKLDWELELGVVIGTGGRAIREEEAHDHVFGYTIVNDLSARDVQEERTGGQWFLGKSLDGTCPMGPAVVSADELDPANLTLSLRVNGVQKQRSTTARMIFPVARLIAELSRYLTLRPGDIIATGTPSGVGAARTPPEFLQAGDVVEADISGIGSLRTYVISAQHTE